VELLLAPPPWATHLLSDLGDWGRRPLPVAELGRLSLPDDAWFEYAWRDAGGQPRPDPALPGPSPNPQRPYARGVAGPRYRPDPYAQLAPALPRGRLTALWLRSHRLGHDRRLHVYAPPVAGEPAPDAMPLPTVLVQDGKAYLSYGRLPQVADALLADGRLRPARFVFVTPVDRNREYVFHRPYLDFVTEELVPFVADRYAESGERVVLGASLGGLVSAVLAWERPDLFGAVAAQSGAFRLGPRDDPPDPYEGTEWLRDQVLAAPPAAAAAPRWHLDCGTLEWLIGPHRRLAAALRERGHAVTARERSAGHNWVNWRDGLAGALASVLPPAS